MRFSNIDTLLYFPFKQIFYRAMRCNAMPYYGLDRTIKAYGNRKNETNRKGKKKRKWFEYGWI